MSPVQMVFLACWAVLDLALVILSPSRKWIISVQGLPKREVLAQWKQPDYAARGCNLVAGNALELLVTLVVEPAYMLWALCTHTGSPRMVLVMGSILVANVLLSVIRSIRDRKAATYPRLTRTRWMLLWFFTIPTLYPWYLLLVLIGILH